MTTAFPFRGQVISNGEELEIAFVFIASEHISPGDVEQALLTLLRDDELSPDLVCYLSPQITAGILQKAIENELLRERHSGLKRSRGCCWIKYGPSGKSGNLSWLQRNAENVPALDSLLEAARNCGLGALARRDGVVTIAPPGSYFLNPSQGRRSYFIRSSMMCLNSSEATFVAFCLLPFLDEVRRQYSQPPNLLWVDTVSIAYIAYALAELGKRLEIFEAQPEIKSFSSYGGLSRTLPGTGEFPAFIISASTSGRLGRDLVETNGGRISEGAICTILGSFDRDFPALLYKIPDAMRGPTLDSFDTLREIRVRGEDFLFNPGEPQIINLRLPQLPSSFKQEFSRLQGKGLVRYFHRVNPAKPPKPLLIDANKLVRDESFEQWLRAKASGSVPLSTKHIVFQNDEASKAMAQIVADAIAPYTKSSVSILSTDDVEAAESCDSDTVVVVAATVGSGMELMRITRALRTFQPKGSRAFLVGVFSARRWMQLAQLKANIQQCDPSLVYSLSAWCSFAPGVDGLSQFRTRERSLFADIKASQDEALTDTARTFAVERLEHMAKDGIIVSGDDHDYPFVSLTGAEAAFDLSKGFALWGPFLECRCAEDVLYTVAAWLQNAREDRNLKPEDRLDDGGFQQSVINPEFMLRFTDPVIQAAIFRCAYDSELDYRSAPATSRRCREILVKILQRREEVGFELLLSICVGRLRLAPDDMKIVLETATDSLRQWPLAAFLAERQRCLQ